MGVGDTFRLQPAFEPSADNLEFGNGLHASPKYPGTHHDKKQAKWTVCSALAPATKQKLDFGNSLYICFQNDQVWATGDASWYYNEFQRLGKHAACDKSRNKTHSSSICPACNATDTDARAWALKVRNGISKRLLDLGRNGATLSVSARTKTGPMRLQKKVHSASTCPARHATGFCPAQLVLRAWRIMLKTAL